MFNPDTDRSEHVSHAVAQEESPTTTRRPLIMDRVNARLQTASMSEVPGQSGHALPPYNRRFVPLPDSCAAAIASLFDDLGAGEQHGRHVDPLRLGRLEVDDQFKFRRSIKRNVLRTFALENISDWGGEAAK
jgi:hypothetical protein